VVEHRAPRVKICGMTCADDVRSALAAGADALGFVHHARSPRHLEARDASELVRDLGAAVTTVAVMVDAEPEPALAWLEESGLDFLQLCGGERAEDWCGFPRPILRRVAVAPAARDELAAWDGVALAFVLDHPGGPGGTGRRVDDELAAELARGAPCLLAGGLDEENVERAVRAVRPLGVDASSRLELAPGRKDTARVRVFVQRAKRALWEVSR